MLTRMVAPTIPPRVDYELTDLGRSLVERLRALGAWALKQEPAVRRARERFDERPWTPGTPRRRQPRVTSGSA